MEGSLENVETLDTVDTREKLRSLEPEDIVDTRCALETPDMHCRHTRKKRKALSKV